MRAPSHIAKGNPGDRHATGVSNNWIDPNVLQHFHGGNQVA